jgi:hypothetical protein
MDQLLEIYGSGKFILDLSIEEDLMNHETLSMFEEQDGYENWIKFLSKSAGSEVIPCALYDDGGSKENFQSQVLKITSKYGKICLRTSAADEISQKLYRWMTEIISLDKIIVCGVLYYIEPRRYKDYENICRDYLEKTLGNQIPSAVLFPGSSFPRYVTDLAGCDDLEGQFGAREITLESELKTKFSNFPIASSDFASVHPIRYQTGGGNWIPRIDIFDGSTFIPRVMVFDRRAPTPAFRSM